MVRLFFRSRLYQALDSRFCVSQKAPQARPVSNRRWSANAVSAEPAESAHNKPSALQGLNNRPYSALAGLDVWSALSAGSVRCAHSTDGYSYYAPAGQTEVRGQRSEIRKKCLSPACGKEVGERGKKEITLWLIKLMRHTPLPAFGHPLPQGERGRRRALS